MEAILHTLPETYSNLIYFIMWSNSWELIIRLFVLLAEFPSVSQKVLHLEKVQSQHRLTINLIWKKENISE